METIPPLDSHSANKSRGFVEAAAAAAVLEVLCRLLLDTALLILLSDVNVSTPGRACVDMFDVMKEAKRVLEMRHLKLFKNLRRNSMITNYCDHYID